MPNTPIKYLSNPLPAGGFPLENEDLINLQEVPRVALNAALAGLGTCFVLSGCDVNDIDVDAGTVYINPGYVFIDGAVRYFPAYVFGRYPFYVVSDTDSVSQKTFEDGNAKDAFTTLRVKTVLNRPTGVQSIAFTPGPVEKISTSITGAIAAGLAAEVQARANADTGLSNDIATKQARVTTRIPWTDIPLASGFTSTEVTTDPNTPFFNRAQYMRTEDGVVHLRGYVRNARVFTKNDSYGGGLMANLPANCLPPVRAEFVTHMIDNYYGSLGNKPFSITTNFIHVTSTAISVDTTYVVNDPNNVVSTAADKSYQTINLDGISYSTQV